MAKGTPALQMPPSLAGEFVWQHLRRHTRHLPHASDHGAKETGPGGRPGRARIGAPGEKEQAPCPSRSRSRRAACMAWGPLPAPPTHAHADCADGRGKRASSHVPVLPLQRSRIDILHGDHDGPWRETVTRVATPVPGSPAGECRHRSEFLEGSAAWGTPEVHRGLGCRPEAWRLPGLRTARLSARGSRDALLRVPSVCETISRDSGKALLPRFTL